MRIRTCIDLDWQFTLGDFPTAIQADFDDADWRTLDLPHDWSVEATPHPDAPARASGGFFPGGLGWYRKKLEIPQNLGDRRVLIEFDGVYQNSEVWCNGQFCGKRPYGYSSFCYDLTPYLDESKQATIAVRVDNSRQLNSRWYSGSGIYRHVWLTLASPVRVGHWGTFVTTPKVTKQQAQVNCDLTLINDAWDTTEVDVVATILEDQSVEPVASSIQVDAQNSATTSVDFEIANPRLWSTDMPNLYTLRIELQRDGQTLDVYDTTFGIREIRYDASEGMFLNGKPIKMLGMNEHHDAGCVGAAVPDDVWKRRLEILKDMGCNAIRIAHNPAAPVLLDMCDEMGFMVFEDAFDEWRDGKTPFGYQLEWDQWWERDLSDMIRRDRNHPSVVMWSVGNEIKEVRTGSKHGLPMMKALQEVCHREDPTRPMTCGCCNSRETLEAGYQNYMDIFGYNGGGGGCFDYEKDHEQYPDMIMFASEVPHSLQTRGVYRTRSWYRDLKRNPNVERLEVPHYTDEEVFTDFDEHYQSSYDNAMVRISSIDSWRRTRDLPYMCGEFRWTGFDYIGECYAWPCKNWNFGVIDLCGFPKDTFFFYQSEWTREPMVHVLPHWTWPGLEGKTIPVMVYTNCDSVELFFNGESLGKQAHDPGAMVLRWDVAYQPGEIRAVAYRGGEVVATCEHATAGEAAAMKLNAESEIRADRTGVAHVEVEIVDAEGRFVPHARPRVTFEVEGPGRLIGLENGDPMDTTNYKLDHRCAFHGRMLAMVQATDEPGTITVTAKAEGFEPASVSISSVS